MHKTCEVAGACLSTLPFHGRHCERILYLVNPVVSHDQAQLELFPDPLLFILIFGEEPLLFILISGEDCVVIGTDLGQVVILLLNLGSDLPNQRRILL
jgi:hypothetical protein